MKRIAGILVFVLAASACGVGDDGPGNGSDDPNAKLGIICNAMMELSGTFTAGTPGRPLDPDTNQPITGCWPVGTWSFTVSSMMNGCKTAPVPLQSYSFRVDRADPDGTGYVETDTLVTSTDMQSHVHVSASGIGCEGALELGSADGTEYWNLQPVLNGTTLAGKGEYTLYKTDSWPWKD